MIQNRRMKSTCFAMFNLRQNVPQKTVYLDRNILKQYLSSKEVEVVTIMMSLFDDEQIMKTYWKDMENTLAHKKEREIAERMIKKGKMTLEEIADCVPAISFDELKEIEAQIMQLA